MVRLTLTAVVLATLYSTSFAAAEDVNGSMKLSVECERNLKALGQADLDTIRGCKVFQGVIDVSQMPAAYLTLSGVEHIIGDLVLSGNSELQSFTAPELQKVEGQVKIENHTLLNKAEFPRLNEVQGISISVAPALETINFPAQLSKVRQARFEDTHAAKIDGFVPESLDNLFILSNNYMTTFDANSVKEITGEFLVHGNNPSMLVLANQLQSLERATFYNLNQLDLPALNTVKGDIQFLENEFTSLSLDNLASVYGTMTIANNNRLTETSFKSLALISGALSIGGNPEMNTIQGFPMLSEIHGTVDLAGSFNDYHLPALQDVRGGMRLQTSSDELGCSDLERKMKGDNIVKGTNWSCTASMQESEMEPTVGQTPSSSLEKSTNGGGSGSSNGSSSSGKSSSSSSSSSGESSSSGSSESHAKEANSNKSVSAANNLVLQGSSLLAFTMGLIYYFA